MTLKKLAFIIFAFSVLNFLSADKVLADIAVFRTEIDEYYPDTTIKKGYCYPMSLTENISFKKSGKTGPGCTFSIDANLTGEWVYVGGFFDTPPYAWGNNVFYSSSKGNFSHTCSNPNYSFDQSSLPSYVRLEGEQNISSGSNNVAPGKKYTFNVSESAPLNTTFNLKLNSQTNCTMFKKDGSTEKVMTPVKPDQSDSEKCGMSQVVEINPRTGSYTLPITINESCITPTPTITPIPTSTPTQTPTPTPTPTSSPTPTPTPLSCGSPCTPGDSSAPCPIGCPICASGPGGNNICLAPTPTITPTPTPPAQCDCDSIEVTNGQIAAGGNFTIRAYAKAVYPDTTAVKNMVYHIERNGTEVANSGEIVAVEMRDTPGRYYTEWTYSLPVEANGTYTYRIWVKIWCEYKANLGYSRDIRVLGVATRIYDNLYDFITGLIAPLRSLLYPSTEPFIGVVENQPSLKPTRMHSLRLGTFYFAQDITKGCTWIEFKVVIP